MFLVLAAFIVIFSVSARDLNVTVDDTAGDERTGAIARYTPNWTPRGAGGDACKECAAQPNGTRAFKGTWHDKSTYVKDRPSTVSINFSGTRIYVFFILVNNNAAQTKNTRLRFYLDGSADRSGDFLHLNDPAGVPYLYDQLVFDSKSLELANHTLLVSSYADNSTGSLALFDYAIYTTISDDSTGNPPPAARPTSQHSSRVGLAIGGSTACVLAILSLLLGAFYWRRRQSALRSELGRAREELARAREELGWHVPFGGQEPPAYSRAA